MFRFDPKRLELGEAPLVLDALPGKASVEEYAAGEARFRVLERLDRPRYQRFLALAERDVKHRIELYRQLSRIRLTGSPSLTSPQERES